VEAINKLTEGFHVKFSLHNCFSDYNVLAKYAAELKKVEELSLELANRDTLMLGKTAEARPAYGDLDLFKEHGYKGKLGIGLIHVQDYDGVGTKDASVKDGTVVETPQLVRDRLLYASSLLDPERINATLDCGLRRKPWGLAYLKLKALTEGAKLAREELGA